MNALHITVATESGRLITLHTRRRTWSMIQRTLRREFWINRNERISRIARIDGGAAYAAPGVFQVNTDNGTRLIVTISAHS
jgi:hypothetical protein